jgi:hypothetical protein
MHTSLLYQIPADHSSTGGNKGSSHSQTLILATWARADKYWAPKGNVGVMYSCLKDEASA